MTVPDAASRRRLATMGIDVWVARGRSVASSEAVAEHVDVASRDGTSGVMRIRVASGTGRWLLVRNEPWSGAHEVLLADIMATLGSGDCRFGQWAVSDSAGVALDDLDELGIEHVLAFGQAPRAVSGPMVHQVPSLEELARRADARRRLWQVISPLLGA